MKKFKFLLLCTLLATAFVACDDKSEEVDQPVLPTVEVEAGEAGEGTLTFTVTSADAETVKYVVIEAGSREVTADLILVNGSTATANEAYEATREGLEYETTYEIWAAARNADGVALSEKVEMTTLPKGDEPGPGDEYTDVLFEAEEADAYIEDGIHQVDFFTGDYTVAVAWRGEEKIVEISDEDGSLLLDHMGVYDRTGGSQESKFVSIVSGYFYTEDEGDGDYWAEGEFITSDNRRFLLSYEGPINGWSEGGKPVEAEEVYLSAEGLTWDIMGDVMGMTVTAVNADYTEGFSFYMNHGFEDINFLPTGMYPCVDTQEGCDALVADYGMEAGEQKQWINGAGAVIMYEGETYELSYNEDLDHFVNIETAMPDQDLTAFTFCLLSSDKTKEFYFSYSGAIYGGGQTGGDDTNIQRSPRDIDYDTIADFSFADGYTTVKFTNFGGDLQLCFNTGSAPLATADAWTEYDVATEMDLAKSYYAEFIEDEMYFYLQSGTIAVKATATGYIFAFYDVKTGAGTGASWGVELNTHSQGFEATLPQVEPDITTISSAYTPGNYVIDRAQVVAMRAGSSFNVMLADNTGAIPATLYPLDDVKIGDWVSIDGNSVTNAPFPAQFTSYSLVTKIESGEYTYPEPYDLTNELAAFAANPSYRYVSVTGTVVAEKDFYGINTYFFEVENGQGVRIKFENPNEEQKTALSENVDKETTILGYIHGGNSEQLLMMLTQVGAEQGGSAEPTVEVEFNPTMGYSQPCGEYGEDFYFTLADTEGNIMGLYIEMQGIYDMYMMNPANEILPFCPSSNFIAAASADEEMVNEVMPGHFLDTTQSYIMYGGKEYKIASASPDWTSGILNYQCMWDGYTPEYDMNILNGTLKAEDGSTFTLYFTGPLYTNGGGIGGL
uniref:hypothetical protein n=1 Tax=Alistipes sp. TaxID=1872444 RepID=UPI00405651EB